MQPTTDFADASAPEDVLHVLRCAAETFDESQDALDTAWQQTNGDVWAWLARRFESFANSLEREMHKHL